MVKTNMPERIEILDGFRFIAILSVALYHFYNRWTAPIYTENLYPYLNTYNYFSLGYLGVQFFFIISGFVIASTLETTHTFGAFLKKRWIRLFPTLVICSTITFLVFNFFDPENLFPRSKSGINLIYSITLVNPELLNFILQPFHIQGSTIAGSYWSLWPEVQFYFLAAALYYLNPSKFLPRFLIVAVSMYLLNKFMFNAVESNLFHLSANTPLAHVYLRIAEIFNLFKFSLWFLAGVLFYQLYRQNKKPFILPALGLIFIFLIYDCSGLKMSLVVTGMFLLFLLFIYAPRYLSFLKFKLFSRIGLVSYSFYLIHENIGVLFIHKFASVLGNQQGLFPLLVIILFAAFSVLLYAQIEKPLASFLKKKIL